MIDSYLNWKSQVSYILKKIKRTIGFLSKIRHYANEKLMAHSSVHKTKTIRVSEDIAFA